MKRVLSAGAGAWRCCFCSAWAEGRAMTLEQAIEYALKENEGPSNDDHD